MNCININRYIFKMDSLTLLTPFRNDASFFAFPRAPCVAMVTSLKPKIRERAPVCVPSNVQTRSKLVQKAEAQWNYTYRSDIYT